MLALDWLKFKFIDSERLHEARQQYHVAVQNVAAVGRRFLGKSDQDINATLMWIPGLSRLAGRWVEGNIRFRSSLSFTDFSIYLVDERVNTISSFSIQNTTHRQIMLWLEEQLGKLGLTVSDLALQLPYKIQESPQLNGTVFDLDDKEANDELAKYYHNTFMVLRNLKKELDIKKDILIWPHHFDEAITVMVKDSGDPETDTTITMGMSPGDETIEEPYFYVSTWPHILNSQFKPLKDGVWVEEDWTGSLFLGSELIKSSDQQQKLIDYFRTSFHLLVDTLKD